MISQINIVPLSANSGPFAFSETSNNRTETGFRKEKTGNLYKFIILYGLCIIPFPKGV